MRLNLLNRLVLVGIIISTFSSCRPDPEPSTPESNTGTITIHFDLNFNGQPFSFYTPYYDVNFNYRIQTELLKFIAYNIKAKNSSNEEILLKDAKMVEFTSDHTSFALDIPAGEYQGMKFGIGVGDSASNHGDPAVYDPSHALSYTGSADMHWTWNTGYIFLKLEGRADTTTNGTGAFNTLFALHTGDDPLYGEVELYASPFTITDGGNTDFHIGVDIAKFLYNSTDTIDIKTEYATHSNNQLAIKFANIYLNAFSAQ